VIIFGVRSSGQNPMPVDYLWPIIDKNITLRDSISRAAFSMCHEHW